MQKPAKLKQWLSLIAVSTTLLTACADKSAISAACPAPIRPTACAVDWYAQAQVPQCFNEYMDKLVRQQDLLIQMHQ